MPRVRVGLTEAGVTRHKGQTQHIAVREPHDDNQNASGSNAGKRTTGSQGDPHPGQGGEPDMVLVVSVLPIIWIVP